jgi:hypothetical protein
MWSLGVIIQTFTKQGPDLKLFLPLLQLTSAKSQAVNCFNTKTADKINLNGNMLFRYYILLQTILLCTASTGILLVPVNLTWVLQTTAWYYTTRQRAA